MSLQNKLQGEGVCKELCKQRPVMSVRMENQLSQPIFSQWPAAHFITTHPSNPPKGFAHKCWVSENLSHQLEFNNSGLEEEAQTKLRLKNSGQISLSAQQFKLPRKFCFFLLNLLICSYFLSIKDRFLSELSFIHFFPDWSVFRGSYQEVGHPGNSLMMKWSIMNGALI